MLRFERVAGGEQKLQLRSCWLPVLCPGFVDTSERNVRKNKDPGILVSETSRTWLFQLDLTPNHVDMTKQVGCCRKILGTKVG